MGPAYPTLAALSTLRRAGLNSAAFGTYGATRTSWAANVCANSKAGLAARDPRDPVFAKGAHLHAFDGPAL